MNGSFRSSFIFLCQRLGSKNRTKCVIWNSLEFYTGARAGTHPSLRHMYKHKHSLVDILVLHVYRMFGGLVFFFLQYWIWQLEPW